MAGEKILIVDDEKEIRELIEIYLKMEGFVSVQASDGLEALKVIKKETVDLIILDVMMPKLDGIQTCMKIREEKNIPIVIVSAKSEDMDKIHGLTIGADDYITKPFNPLELVARVKSQIRRSTVLNKQPKELKSLGIVVEDVIINKDRYEVLVSGEEVKLTPTEFEILHLLASNPGKVFTTENIYESVWKENFMDSKNTVVVHIRKIREKIEKNPQKPNIIKTVWGVGYKIEKK